MSAPSHPQQPRSAGRITAEEAVSRAQRLTPVLRERAARTESLRSVPMETVEELASAGLLKLLQPARFGGNELDFGTLLEVGIELGKGCGSSAWVSTILASQSWLLSLFPDEAQQDVWGRAPEALAAAALAPHGKVRRVDGGYRLTGNWPFASGVDHAQWVLLGALVFPEKEGAPPDVKLFLVPKAEGRVDDTWFVSGLRGTGSKNVVVEDVFVPEHRTLSLLLLREGTTPGAAVNTAPVYRLPFMASLSFAIPGAALGMALGALEAWTERTRSRSHTFTGEQIARLAPAQIHLSECAAELDSARLLLRRDTEESLRIVTAGGTLTLEQRARYRRDVAWSGVLCSRAINRLSLASGGSGLYETSPVQRAWRDINAACAHVIMNWDAAASHYGRLGFGLQPETDPFF